MQESARLICARTDSHMQDRSSSRITKPNHLPSLKPQTQVKGYCLLGFCHAHALQLRTKRSWKEDDEEEDEDAYVTSSIWTVKLPKPDGEAPAS